MRPIAAAMRRLIFATLIFLAIGPVPGTHRRRPVDSHEQTASARRLTFPALRDGSLHFVAGWRLVSPNSKFGSFSSIAHLGPNRFQLAGDNGQWVRLTLDDKGMVSDFRIHALPSLSGTPKRKALTDAEAMFVDPASGQSWIALENINQIWRLNAAMTRIESRRTTPALSRWPANRGAEAMVKLADGRTIVFSEDADDDPRGTEALIYDGDPAAPGAPPTRFFYDSQGRGLVSDAAPLPDGRILLVHRRLGLRQIFTTIVSIADPADIAGDAVLRSTTIGRIPAILRENYEGAAIAIEDGRTYLWLVSDDNFNSWQRSLLLKIELIDLPPRQQKGGAVASPP